MRNEFVEPGQTYINSDFRMKIDDQAGSHQPNPERQNSTELEFGPYVEQQLDLALQDFGEAYQTSAHEAKTGILAFDSQIEDLLKHARTLMDHREFRLALNVLRVVLQRSSHDHEGLERLGACLMQLERYDEALCAFRALVNDRPRISYRLKMAETLYLLERNSEARVELLEILPYMTEMDGDLFLVYKTLGNIAVREGDFETAEEYFNKAYTLNSRSDVLMVNFGTLEIQRENLSLAVERFREGIQINSANDKAWVGLALVHRQMGDFELAMGNLDRAMDLNPDNSTALKLYVEWALNDQRAKSCVARLQDYLERHFDDVEMSFTLAKLFVYLGHFAEAEIELERTLALNPGIEGGDRLAALLKSQRIEKSMKAT